MCGRPWSSSKVQRKVPLCVAFTGPPMPPIGIFLMRCGGSKNSVKVLVMQAEAQLSILMGTASVSKFVERCLDFCSDA